MLQLHVLGNARITKADDEVVGIGKRGLGLLIYMAVEGLTTIARADATSLLWDGRTDGRTRHSLSQMMYGLRRSVPELHLVGSSTDISLDPPLPLTDYEDLRRARAYFDLSVLQGSTSLQFAPNLDIASTPFEAWRVGHQQDLDVLTMAILHHHIRRAFDAGNWAAAIELSDRIAASDPYDETAIETRVSAMAALGDIDAARQHLEEVRDLYRRDLSRTLPARLDALKTTFSVPEYSDQFDSVGDTNSIRPQLVGRDETFSRLRQFLEEPNDGSLFALVGPPGIGKSRLCDQIARLAVIRGRMLLRGSGRPTQQDVAYGVLGDILENCRGLEAALRNCPEAHSSLGAVLPSLQAQRVASEDGSGSLLSQPRAVFGAVERLIKILGATRQVVLVIDDGQWVDASTLAFLDFAKRPNSSLSIKLVLAARPADTSHKVLRSLVRDAKKNSQAVDVQPLDENASRALAINVIAKANITISQSGINQCLSAAGGRPLFIIDMIKQWQVAANERSTVPTASPSVVGSTSKSLPPTLQHIYRALLDSTHVRARVIARALAVAGGRAMIGDLEKILGLTIGSLLESIEELREVGLVRDDASRICFEHDLVTEAIYQGTGSPERALLHRAVAIAMESSDQAPPSVLAYHYDSAGDRAPAFRYATAAIRPLIDDHCFVEAEAQVHIANRNACDPSQRHEYLSLHADLLLQQGRWGESFPILDELAGLCHDDVRETTQLRREVARICSALEGRATSPALISADLRKAFLSALSLRDELSGAKVASLTLLTAHEMGTIDAVSDALRVVLQFARGCDAIGPAVDLLAMGAVAAGIYEGHQAGVSIAEIGVSRSSRDEDPTVRIRALLGLGNTQIMAGNIRAAGEIFDQIDGLLANPEVGPISCDIHNNSGVARLEQADYPNALLKFEYAEEARLYPSWLYAIANRAIVHFHQGDMDGLTAASVSLYESANTSDATWPPMIVDTLLGLAAVERGERDTVKEYLDSVRAAIETGGARITDSSYVYIFIARALKLLGKLDEGLDILERHGKVLEGFHEPGRLRVQLERAELMHASNPTESRRLARKIEAEAREFGLPESAKRAAALLA